MQLIYVNPSNTAVKSRVDERGQQFETGTSKIFEWPAPSGPNYIGGLVAPSPARDIYEYRDDPAPRPDYNTLISVDENFIGTVQDPAAYVQVVNNWDPVSLLELYNIKIGELRNYTFSVFDSAFSLTWNTRNYWVRNDEVLRSARASYNAALAMEIGERLDQLQQLHFDARQAGINAGGGTNAEVAAWWAAYKVATFPTDWWERDIKTRVYVDNPGQPDDLQQVTDTANKTQWIAIVRAEGTFNYQVNNADDRVRQSINDAYGNGQGVPGGPEWNQLASIDPSEAQYNWPKHYIGPPELGSTGPLINGL